MRILDAGIVPSPRTITTAALLALAGLCSPASAQDGPRVAKADAPAGSPAPASPAVSRPENAELLALFLHYCMIDNHELAAANGQELLDRKLSNADFVTLVESAKGGDMARFEQAVARAIRITDLEPVASKILKSYETGKLERSRDPSEIASSIKALTGAIRGKLEAQQRLKHAGEYAMPQLLSTLLNPANDLQQEEVRRVMIDLGRQAVIPLGTALAKLDGPSQERAADILGLVGNRVALPFLSDLKDTTQIDSVRTASARAIDRLGGATGLSTAQLYGALAEGYYEERPEVTMFPGEEHQLLWSFDPRSGLVMTPLRSPVFHEAMGMRLAERSLQLAPDSQPTLALWIATNFKREVQTPQGYANPAYPVAGSAAPGTKARREAMYYAVAAGSNVCQQVLARGLDSGNVAIARKAIAALERTAGGGAMWGEGGSSLPMTRALSYPNRRVQYEAAAAVAAAQPRQSFAGAERVVPTLASAARDAGNPIAAIITSETETYQALRRTAEAAGFGVLPQGRTLGDLDSPIAEAPAVDLIIVHNTSGTGVPTTLEAVRGSTKVSVTPVLALVGVEASIDLMRRYESDPLVMVRSTAIGEQATHASIKALLETAAGGPITAGEASAYATRALDSLRDLAISGNPVLNVEDAMLPLVGLLDATGKNAPTPENRAKVAEILSRIGNERAQRSLMESALANTSDQRLALLSLVADSAKRFGNKLEERHVKRVLEMTGSEDDKEATSAAALMGALNLPNSQLIPLILKN